MKNLVSINNLTGLEIFSLIRKALTLKKENLLIRQYDLLVSNLFFENITNIGITLSSFHRVETLLFNNYKNHKYLRCYEKI